MAANYYIGITEAGDVVARASTRADYTHASVEHQTIRWISSLSSVHRGRGPRGHFVADEMIDHKGQVSLGRCHFSTSPEGALKLVADYVKAGAKVELVEVKLVSAKEYRACLRTVERLNAEKAAAL